MERQESGNLQEYEAKAEELITLTLGVCEQRMQTCEEQGEVLSSAAMSVRESVKTSLAVTRLPNGTKEMAK